MLPLVGAMDPNAIYISPGCNPIGICHRNLGKSGLVDLHRLDLGKNMKNNIR